ncbi:MAG: NAD(P)-dependent oxidoreductase [Alphaproteobacteria bacterium]|nr:NAD(P)-dependent oxidoreductase [Alphaproteobacteria bacterium]
MGSAVVEALVSNGHEVIGLDRRSSGRSHEALVEKITSLDDAIALTEAMQDVDAVLHLGAFMSWAAADHDEMFRSNVDGTRTLLEAAAAAGVKRFVFASSGEVYPENAPKSQPITEDHPLCPNSPYGLTKLLGEELVRFHQRRGRMETVILRFSHTQDAAELLDEDSFFSGPRFFYAPRIRQQEAFGNDAVVELLHQREPGRPAHILSRSESGRPFRMHITDTRDMVAGLLLALDHPAAAGEVFNLGATEPVDFEPLISAMSQITGYPVVSVDLPGPGVFYETSNRRIREVLGYAPEWTIERMLEDAAAAREKRATG